MKLETLFPIIESIKGHKAADWRKDLVAGIMVAVLLVPQGMAYAMLAGLPPIYGLYGGLIPLLLYGLLGTSRQLSIGPVAISALLVLAGVSQIAEPETPEYINLVLTAGLLIGVAQLLLSVIRLGFLVNFISHPVIVGFTSAASIIIAISQLKDVLGISIPRFIHSFETLSYAIQHLGETNIYSLLLSTGAILIIIILRKISRAIPSALLVVVAGTLLVYFSNGESLGLKIVGEVPEGFPVFQAPILNWEIIQKLMPIVFTVTTIGIVESISIAKVIQSKHQNYSLRPNQELLALGVSKIGGAFFQALPTSGSFTRSAINNDSGAQSGIASIFTAIIIGLTLLFFTPYFYYLPKAVLAAIILLAVKSLFDFNEGKHLWKTDRPDFFMMLATFLVTLILGIEEGVMAGVVLSILMVLYRSSRPHLAVLGKLPQTRSYRNVNRFENAEQPDDVLVVRFDDQLYFGNADFFKDSIKGLAKEKGAPLQLIVIDCSSIHEIDSTGLHALEQLLSHFREMKIDVYFARFIGPVRDKILKTGLMEKIGMENQFLQVQDAVDYHTNLKMGVKKGWNPEAIQTNPGS